MKSRTTLSALLLLCLVAVTGPAQAGQLEDLQKQIDELSSQMKSLREQEASRQAATAAAEESYLKKTWQRTRFGGYGELDYIFRKENGNGKGGNSFDPHRLVLYVNSDLADWLTLNTELEWEHGGFGDEISEGEVVVEQAFLDFKISDPFNIKAGVMLMPLGGINLYHEPTNFNSTERPEVDKFLIPSTWKELGVGIHGKLGDRVDYQLMVTPGLNGSGFSGKDGLRDGRQNFGSDSNRDMAYSARLEVRPYSNLYTNLSFYTGNSAPKGAPSAYTTIAAFDGRYSLGNFDLAGEYVRVFQDNPSALGVSDIGHSMSGFWVEGAYHVMPNFLKKGRLADADAVVFARYSELDTQMGGAVDPAQANGRFDRSYTTFGLAFKPVPTVVVKADYQIYSDNRAAGETPLDNNKFQMTLGFVF